MKNIINRMIWIVAMLVTTVDSAIAAPVGHVFTFQGRLMTTNGPAQGPHDFEFALWDRAFGGNYFGTVTREEWPVSNGLFTVDLDFGSNVFVEASERFIEISVIQSDSTNDAVVLSPRTRLAPAPFAVTAANVPDGSISSAKIANGAVTGSKLASGAVGFAQLGVWSVDLDRIADNAITSNKLAPNSVHGFHLVTGTVQSIHLADGSISTPKLADAAVTAQKIAHGAVSNQHLAANSVGSMHLLANSVNSSKIADGSILGVDLAAGTITSTNLAKPYSSGVISLAGKLNTFSPLPVYQALIPPFVTTPVITFGVTPSVLGQLFATELASNTATGFSVRLRSVPHKEPIATLDSDGYYSPSIGVVSVGSTTAPACVVSIGYSTGFGFVRQGVYFARATDASGYAWNMITINTNGGDAALLADGINQTIIAYMQRIGLTDRYGLFCVRATSPDGSAWSNPANCDVNVYSARQLSMAMIDGRPSIVYIDNVSSGNVAYIKFVRSNDAIGATWGTPKILVTEPYFALSSLGKPRLLIANGKPAVVLSDGLSLLLCRATDAAGTNWNAAVTIYTATNGITYSDAAIVGGRLAVAFGVIGETAGRYLTATDEAGTSWYAPSSWGHSGAMSFLHPHLVDAGGMPGIAYTSGGPFYTEALDPLGMTWGPKIRLDSSPDARGSSVLPIHGGLAQIVALDNGARLEYIWSGPYPENIQWTAVQP